jgi:hypothetical protein
MQKLEFVEYTGRYPNLCSGRLFVKIDGKLVSFGNYCLGEKGKTDDTNVPNYHAFWITGGWVKFYDNWEEDVGEGDWKACWKEENYSKEIVKLLPRLLKLFNKNVPHGCCGGCV